MISFILLAAVVGTVSCCNYPSRLWCSSPEIAIQCKVYQQCKEFEWAKASAPLVSIELYYESLCPDCQQFISQQLYPTYTKVGQIMNITLVPYGNAQERQSAGGEWHFTCQHGPQECKGNVIETCSIYAMGGDMKKIMPFIDCMESSSDPIPFKKCARKFKVPYDSIVHCFNGSMGNKLEHEMAKKTDALNPPHQYVPWIVLNGVHTEKINQEAQDNLLKLICDTYTGPKPAGCQEVEKRPPSVCYRKVSTKLLF